ncbi:NAD(P)/FAD-dependent oxidoreductase [Brasilonema sp. UFV-L1]|uniref:NAD(P)/FAD-dependent oxidoreductase n=1 Tax=Brasilonema sp. UFV-L1 TaxID=2234130 RepID=UPI00145CB07C|nr:NAD(P)/FAD-dependent oxidoreductase [Brasilonema sp. UFV-L1]NMG09909.1 FAD-binding protein [Brasilonema sp. UFV-L1]
MSTQLPSSTQVLVVGGGPAGSTAATLLARQGFDVTLVEKAITPRYHIGESLLPAALEMFDLLGVREKVESYGFQQKEGAYFVWGPRQWGLEFQRLLDKYTFQVRRGEFDRLLLDHATSLGVKFFEGIEIRKLSFDGDRPTSATWSSVDNSGEISFNFLVDASGRYGLMSTQYLHNRRYHKEFQNIAIWGYWKNADFSKIWPENATVSARTNDGSGWIWAIPLSDGTLSTGLVMNKEIYKQRKSQASLEEIYAEGIADTPYVTDLVSTAELVSPVKVEQDYSYSAEKFAGPGYFMLGDAACFLDPLLSTGVHLAFFSGILSAACIGSILRNEVTEEKAYSFYDQTHRFHYLTLLIFVSSFYHITTKPEDMDMDADPSAGPRRFIAEVEDLQTAQPHIRDLVAEHMVELLTKAEQGVRLMVAEELAGTAKVAAELDPKHQAVFLQLWRGVFGYLPDFEGLRLMTQPELKLVPVNEDITPAITLDTVLSEEYYSQPAEAMA